MQAGQMRKRSRLLVHGTIEEDAGIIDAPIGRDRFQRQRMAVRADGRSARTEFQVLERLPGYTSPTSSTPWPAIVRTAAVGHRRASPASSSTRGS
jgi:23S rRNA-/tRNA-specific pseudouridylate synthase